MDPRPRPSIIVADNNEFYRQVMGDFYRELGYEVRVAVDGLEALEMIQERAPDLLLLDLIMPRLDGARLSSFIKGQEAWRGLPIIILSGILADEIDGVEAIRADAYVAKMPLDQIRDALKGISERLLAGRAGTGPTMAGFEKMYRREVVLELLQERKTAQEILDSLSEGIVELSTERRLLSCNHAFRRMSGRNCSELLSHPIEEIFPASRPVIKSLFSEIDSGAPIATAAIRHGERDLQVKLHRFAPAPVGEGTGEGGASSPGGIPSGVHHAVRRAAETTEKVQLKSMISSVGYTLLAEDITQRVKAEREREQLRARLAHSEKMSAIGVFVSGAAHELNNPLTSVLGYAQLLLQKHQGGDLHKELEKIAAGADRCKTIVENLMTFARAHRPEKVPIDLGGLLREAAAVYREKLDAAGVTLVLDPAPGLPSTLADPEQIHQAFLAIVDNAWKALSEHAGDRTLSLSTRLEKGRIQVEFADSGPGIPEQVLGRVFEPFFTTRQVGRGAGLGLSVAYGLVTAHAGRILARNRPGGGASITLEFPVLEREPASRPEPPAAAAPELSDPGRRSILIVDDEEVVLDLLVDILEGDRHRIETACNGLDGLRKIEAGRYDLVILDLRMPDMTGQQMYEELKRRMPEMIPRILFITADTVTPDVEGFLRSVRRPCLTKPFAIDNVLQAVRRILPPENAPAR